MKGLIIAVLIIQLITATQQTDSAATVVDIKVFWEWASRYIKPVIYTPGSTSEMLNSSGLNFRGSECDDEDFFIIDGSIYCYEDTHNKNDARLNLLIGKRLILRIFRAASWRYIDVTAECASGSQLEIADVEGSWFSKAIDKRSFTWDGSREWKYWLRCQTTTNDASSEVINGAFSHSTNPTAETRTSNEQITDEHSGSSSPKQGADGGSGGQDRIGLIVGLSLGFLILVVIIIGLVLFIMRLKLRNAKQRETPETVDLDYTLTNTTREDNHHYTSLTHNQVAVDEEYLEPDDILCNERRLSDTNHLYENVSRTHN